jgi:spermidine synthase
VRTRSGILAVYFLSGACGLVYEVVWTRYLQLTFGITVFATTAVLAAYMAGLGLGSWLVGRRIDGVRDPLRAYALLEIGIGLYALAVSTIFRALTPVYVEVANALADRFLLFNLARAGLAFAVLLVPTTLMGGTVPAMGRYLVTRRESIGRDVGLLYAVNTVGAVVGCLVTGFVLLPTLGMARTVACAAAINVAIGLALLPGRRYDARDESLPRVTDVVRTRVPAAVVLAVLVVAISGFSSLASEVVWTRVLVIHLFNTTYAFSIMLAMYLAGIALGGALPLRYYDRVERPLTWLGAVQVAVGLAMVMAACAYLPLRWVGTASTGSWILSLVVMTIRAAIVLLPAAFLFGVTFPLVVRVMLVDLGRTGRHLAGAYTANTVGAVLGAVVGGFVLIPQLGLRGTLLALSGLNVAAGAACWWMDTTGFRRWRLVGVAAIVLVLPSVLVPRTIFFDALQGSTATLIHYREGVTDTTGVWEYPNGMRIVTYGDMRGTAGTHTDLLNRAQGHLAHLLHPAPRRSLQICFGVGNTLAAAALHPEVERLDCVELSPHVRETAKFFWTNHGVLDDPKVRLIIDDGRNYLLRTRRHYDVITLEPPDIFTAGVVNLYTEEFYRLAAGALAPDGILCQWLPIGEMEDVEMRMLVRAFQEVFPETSMWREALGPGASPLLLVGSKRPLHLDPAVLAMRMRNPAIAGDLARIGMGTPEGLAAFYLGGPEETRRWIAAAPSVTDDRTVVDFTNPRSPYSGFGFGYFRASGAERARRQRHIAELAAWQARMHAAARPLWGDR